MNKLLLAAGLLATGLTATAQTPPRPARQIQLTEHTPVTSADGVAVPYAEWRPLLATGQYRLTAVPGTTADNPVFRLVARTAAERAQYLAQLPPPEASPFFTTGQALAPFKLRDLQGRKYDSRALLGKVVVLNFWFIGCPPCRQEIPDLNELVRHYAGREDVVFLAVALDERDAIERFARQTPYAYALIPDGRDEARKYGVASFPTNLVLDRQGKVVFHAQYHPNMKSFLQKAIDESK